MKKRLLWIAIGVVLAVASTVVTVLIVKDFQFHSEGFHADGTYLHIEGNWTGYIFNAETGETLGQTPVEVEVTSNKEDHSQLEGDMIVLGYQNSSDGTMIKSAIAEQTESGCYVVHYFEECQHEADLENKQSAYTHFCQYYYTYYFYPEKENFVAVSVEEFDANDQILIICAESEEQAKSDFEWFMENKPEE